MLYEDTMKNNVIKGYVPKPYVSTVGTLPPKVTDLKPWVDPNAFKDFYILPSSPIRMKFVLNKGDAGARTPASEYHVKIENIDTNEVKHYVLDADDKPFKLWEKYEEAYTNYVNGTGEIDIDNIPNSIVNGRMTISPMNENGIGKSSVFILPMAGIVPVTTWMINDYPITSVFEDHWNEFLPEPENPQIKPRYLFIYLNTQAEVIEKDHEEYQNDEWFQTTPFRNWREINRKTPRWRVDDYESYEKYDHNGWSTMTLNEIQFIDRVLGVISPLYREDLTDRHIDFSEPHIFKAMVPNPFDYEDSIYIYVMKGVSWQI